MRGVRAPVIETEPCPRCDGQRCLVQYPAQRAWVCYNCRNARDRAEYRAKAVQGDGQLHTIDAEPRWSHRLVLLWDQQRARRLRSP